MILTPSVALKAFKKLIRGAGLSNPEGFEESRLCFFELEPLKPTELLGKGS
jgi:hypothetical protein